MNHRVAWSLLAAALVSSSNAWVPSTLSPSSRTVSSPVNRFVSTAAAESSVDTDATEGDSSLTQDLISKLRFRDLRRELEGRDLDASGTTAQLRDRLRVAALGVEEACGVDESADNEACDVSLY